MANTRGDLCIIPKAQKFQLKIIRHCFLPKYQSPLGRLVILSAGEASTSTNTAGIVSWNIS